MILVDTGPLVAICDARDSHHARAIGDLERLANGVFATCEAVLAEACFHLSADAQRRRLRALLDELDVAVLPLHDGQATRDEVFDWLAKYAEHDPDWADGCIAVLASRISRSSVWTYDREFRTTWRRRDGKKIALAVL